MILRLTVNGEELTDLVDALRTTQALVEAGLNNGKNEGETCAFSFAIEQDAGE